MITNNLRKLSIGFLVAILIAISAFPTANSLPTGITDEKMTTDTIAADGCYCHTTNTEATASVIVNLTLPESDAITIGGYVMDLSKKIPLYGEIVKDEFFTYKVLSHSRKQILKLEISKN